MQYLLFINNAPDIDPAAAPEKEPMDIEDWVDQMDARGVRKFGDRLQSAQNSTTVRVRKGELLLTDGPFVEAKDYIAGIDVIECENLDEAIEIARLHPMATHGLVEIRPFWVWED